MRLAPIKQTGLDRRDKVLERLKERKVERGKTISQRVTDDSKRPRPSHSCPGLRTKRNEEDERVWRKEGVKCSLRGI